LPSAAFAPKLDRPNHAEPGLLEGPQGPEIAFLWVANDGTHVRVGKDNLPYKLADRSWTQAKACHAKLPYREVDTSRTRLRAQFICMVRIVRPEIPLNPAYRPTLLFDHEYVRRLNATHTRTIFRLNAWQVKSLIPPSRDVGGGKPFLEEWKVASFKRSE